MSKTFQQLLAETTGPKRVKPAVASKSKAVSKSAAPKLKAKPASKPAAKKTIVREGVLTLSDLGMDVKTEIAKGRKQLDEMFAMAPVMGVVNIDKAARDDHYDLDMSDIGFIMESDDEDRNEENSQDTMEDGDEEGSESGVGMGDGTPKSGAASMSNPSGSSETDSEEGGEKADADAPPVGGDPKKYQTVSLTVPALMRVLKAVAQKTPDNVTIASMVMSMAHFCDGQCEIDVPDLEEIKHKMHGMEYNSPGSSPEGEEGAVGGDEGEGEDAGTDPSAYATDDVVDGDEGEKDDSPFGGEDEGGDEEDEVPPGDDSEGGDSEETDDSSDEEKPADGGDSEESGDDEGSEGGDEESDDEPKYKDLDEEIEAVFEGITAKDMTAIRRRSGLANYWKN